jgi:hypothetical protein
MSEREEPILSLPRSKPERDDSGRRYRVEFDLIYDGGGSSWTGWYRTYFGARWAMFWMRRFPFSWGGTAELFDSAAPGGKS